MVGFFDDVGNGFSSKASKSCLSDKMVDHFVLLLLLMPPPTSLGKTLSGGLCDDLYDKKTLALLSIKDGIGQLYNSRILIVSMLYFNE